MSSIGGGNSSVSLEVSSTSDHQGILVGTTSAEILANPRSGREKTIIHNAANILYVRCGDNASDLNFTYRLTRNTTLEIDNYIGLITGIASGGTTYVSVTELS